MKTDSNSSILPEETRPSALGATAEARAVRLGTTVDHLLVDDRHSLRTSTYPTDDCFRPHEIEQYARGDLSEARIAHGQTCEACEGLLLAAQSWERPLDIFLDEVRSQKHRIIDEDLKISLTDAVMSGGPVILLGLISAGVVYAKWDASMSVAIAPFGWGLFLAPLITILIASCTILTGFAVAKKSGHLATFRRFSGAAIGSVFTLFFVLGGGLTFLSVSSNYQRVQGAEEFALGIAASRLHGGQAEWAQIAVPASTRTLMGSIVAEPKVDQSNDARFEKGNRKEYDAFDIYWNQEPATSGIDLAKLKSLSTAYIGRFERSSDGKVTVKTARQTIGLKVPKGQLSELKGNETVFAIVSASEQEASKVLPVQQLLVKEVEVPVLGQ